MTQVSQSGEKEVTNLSWEESGMETSLHEQRSMVQQRFLRLEWVGSLLQLQPGLWQHLSAAWSRMLQWRDLKSLSLIQLFCHSVVSNSLWPCGLQHARPPCPSPSPRACSNSCPLSQWCQPTVSSSVAPFSFCLQSFPASGSFPVSRLFTSGSQNIGASASASVHPRNIQGWFPLGMPGLISLLPKRLSRVFSSTTVWKHQFFGTQPSLWFNSHPYMTTGKMIALTRWTFVNKIMSLLFNVLPRFVIAFLPRSKHFIISWLQSPSAVITLVTH